MPPTGPHPFSYDEEMESFNETTTEPKRGATTSGAKLLSRPSFLFMIALVSVVLFATFLTDSIEISININTVEKKEVSKSGSSSDSWPPKNSDQIGMAYENEIQSGKFAPSNASTADSDQSASEPEAPQPAPVPAPETPATDPVPANTESVPAPATQPSASAFHPLAGEPGYKVDPQLLSDTYLKRGKPIDNKEMANLAKTWGQWTFVDPKADQRPQEDFYVAYPNRDVPYDKFPDNAWQKDKDYLSKFVPEAKALVERAMESILAEYGHSKFNEPDKDFETRAEMFLPVMYNFTGPAPDKNKGGWMPQRSFDGLVRRVLHSIMTEDTFTLATGGHSAAAGHGNHFQQSYTLQFQRVLEPVFARLGVKCTAYNICYGGLGTLQSGLATSAVLGPDTDILLWDSGMTEGGGWALELFARQGMIGGNRVPVYWADRGPLQFLYENVDADVGDGGVFPNGMIGIPKTVDATQVQTLPWAAQYVDCDKDMAGECGTNKYRGKCWIERPDFTPPEQKPEPGGRASWHPGFRIHQLRGRVMAFAVLRALDKGLTMWNEAANFVLPDDAWHVTAYYDNIRSKIMSLKETEGTCHDLGLLPQRVCNTPMRAKTEFTPRYSPWETSIRSIIKPGVFIDSLKPNLYDPPDVRNPALDVPDGAFDYLAVVENGVDFVALRARKKQLSTSNSRRLEDRPSMRKLANPAIVPGQGWTMSGKVAPDNCDGTYDSFCGRDNQCLLSAHNDERGGILADSFSGWMILNLADLQHGIVIVKFEDWHQPGAAKLTEGWTCENNSTDCQSQQRRLAANLRRPLNVTSNSAEAVDNFSRPKSRILKPQPPEYCKEFEFDFALDGAITTWNLDQWMERHNKAQRVVQLWTLLDDPNYTGGKTKDVELAFRFRGCGRNKAFRLSHIYWA